MPNTQAILGIAQAGAKTAAQALAPSASAVAAGATTGTLGTVLGAAVPILGIAAVAAPVISNLFSCGTVSHIGCEKVSDSTALTNLRLAALTTAYQVESGAVTPEQGAATIQQLSQAAAQAFQNPQRSWISPATFYEPCGSFTNNGAAETGPPCSSRAAQVIPTGASVTGPQMIQDYLGFIQSQPAPVASAAAASIGSAANSVVSSIANALGGGSAAPSAPGAPPPGIPGWLLLAGAAVGAYLLLQ